MLSKLLMSSQTLSSHVLLQRFWEGAKDFFKDLRFDEAEEADFKQSLESRYLFPLGTASFIGVMMEFWKTYSMYTLLAHTDFTLLFWLMTGIRVLTIALAGIIFAMCIWKSISSVPGYIGMESTAVAASIWLVFSFALGDRYHMPVILGLNPNDISAEWEPCGSEGVMVMGILIVVTGLCTTCPVRSHIAWIHPTASFLQYILYKTVIGSAAPAYAMLYAPGIFLMSLLATYGSRKKEEHEREKWLAHKRIEKQQDLLDIQHEGVCRILGRFCDCLIQLGPDYSIVHQTNRLAAMLLYGAQTTFQNTNFCDCIFSEDDRQKFLKSIANAVGTSEMLPLRLRDSRNREVMVQVYHTSYNDIDGLPTYLVAIVECEERTVYEDQQGWQWSSQQSHQPTVLGASSSGQGFHQEKESYSGESIASLESVSGDIAGEMACTFRDDELLTILSCTPAFSALIGPMKYGMSFTDLTSNARGRERDSSGIMNMVQILGNSLSNAEIEVQDIVLSTPVSRSAGVEYVALDWHVESVAVCDMVESVGGDRERHIKFRLSFENIQQRKVKQARERGGRVMKRGRDDTSQAVDGGLQIPYVDYFSPMSL